MWLGSSQQLDKINIRDIPLLSASVTVVNTARDLGVILDSQLSLNAPCDTSASVCRSSYYQQKQLRPVVWSLSVEAANTSPGVCIQPTGLLQRHTTWSTREADETPAVGAERCRADDNQCTAA